MLLRMFIPVPATDRMAMGVLHLLTTRHQRSGVFLDMSVTHDARPRRVITLVPRPFLFGKHLQDASSHYCFVRRLYRPIPKRVASYIRERQRA
jgi:hypothetical protein